MKIIVKVRKPIAQVRSLPTESSEAISILTIDNSVQYTATKLFSGWYYLEEVAGWVQDNDLDVMEIIEPYDPDIDVDFGTSDDTDNKGVKYDAKAIIEALKKYPDKLPSTEIIHTSNIDGEMKRVILSTILNSLDTTLVSMKDVIDKVEAIPAIPKLPVNIEPGLLLNINASGKLEWSKLDYDKLTNAPDTSDIIGLDEF